MRPSVKVAVGVVLGSLVALVPWACGAGAQKLPAVVQCQLDALQVLPRDLGNVTVYDAIDIYERVRACKQQHPDDAGAP
jgi:hypothetical protein